MKTVVAFCLFLLCISASVDARMVTARGEVGYGSLDSGIDDANQLCCGFMTKSGVANTIFASCGMGDECEIIGEIDKNYFFDYVYSVRKVDVAVEPSAKVIRSAACWASSVDSSKCNSVISNISVEVISLVKEFNESKNRWLLEYVVSFVNNYQTITKEIARGSVVIEKIDGDWVYKAAH